MTHTETQLHLQHLRETHRRYARDCKRRGEFAIPFDLWLVEYVITLETALDNVEQRGRKERAR